MANELSLLDTNVLVYALYQGAPHHAASRKLLDAAQRPDAALCLVPQSLAEFYAVVTNPKRVTSAKSSEDAIGAIESFLQLPGLILLPVAPDLVTRWIALLRQHAVTGHRVFDLH